MPVELSGQRGTVAVDLAATGAVVIDGAALRSIAPPVTLGRQAAMSALFAVSLATATIKVRAAAASATASVTPAAQAITNAILTRSGAPILARSGQIITTRN